MPGRAETDLTTNYDDEDTIDDEDDEDDDVINEDPTILIQESPSYEFCKYMTEAKKKLYVIIVLGPEDEESAAAQDDTLLEKYIKELDLLGKSIIKLINRPTSLVLEEELKNYSPDTKNLVQDTLHYTNTFLKTNSNINKVPYIDLINNQYTMYPFFQLPLFPK